MALISTWTLVISRIPDNLSRRLISQSESTCEGVLLLQTTPFWLLVLVSFIKFHYLLLFCGQVKETVCTLQRPLPPPLMTSLFLNLARFWAQLIQSEIHSHGSNSKTMSINKNKQKNSTKLSRRPHCFQPSSYLKTSFEDKQNSNILRSRGQHQSCVNLIHVVDSLTESVWAARDSIVTQQITIWHKAPRATHICLAVLKNGAETAASEH